LPRHLHSFPTRRSSDLRFSSFVPTATGARRKGSPPAAEGSLRAGTDGFPPPVLYSPSYPPRTGIRTQRPGQFFDLSERCRRRFRSEEHTSELQSRSDLV